MCDFTPLGMMKHNSQKLNTLLNSKESFLASKNTRVVVTQVLTNGVTNGSNNSGTLLDLRYLFQETT